MAVNNLLVSVIIPFYNEKLHLEEAVDSVVNQTYTNWELLLVDDGSNDVSTQIAKDYAAKFSGRIFYFDHEAHANKGASPSRNLGLGKAKGDYTAFLDSDDYWMPEKLEKQVELAIKFPDVAMFCEATRYLNKGRNPAYENKNILVGVKPEQVYTPPSLLLQLYPLGYGEAPCMNSLFIKTDFLKNIGGFEESFGGATYLFEDQAFLVKIYFHGNAYVSSLCNNVYRQRDNSMMHKGLAKGGYIKGRKYFFKWFEDYLAKQNVQYPELKKLFKKSSLSLHYPRIYKYTYGIKDKFFK